MLMNIARKNSKFQPYHHVPRLRIPQRKKDESLPKIAHEFGGFQRRILGEPRRSVCHTRDADKEEVAISFTGEKFFLNRNSMPTLWNENT
jgi:hypothetical protein